MPDRCVVDIGRNQTLEADRLKPPKFPRARSRGDCTAPDGNCRWVVWRLPALLPESLERPTP
jgi:hypothetical protein